MTVTTTAPETITPTLQLNPVMRRKQRTLWGDAWVSFRRSKLAMFGLFVLSVLVIVCLAGPLFYAASAEHIDIMASEQAPSREHPMGTDDLGRDGLARNLQGGVSP